MSAKLSRKVMVNRSMSLKLDNGVQIPIRVQSSNEINPRQLALENCERKELVRMIYDYQTKYKQLKSDFDEMDTCYGKSINQLQEYKEKYNALLKEKEKWQMEQSSRKISADHGPTGQRKLSSESSRSGTRRSSYEKQQSESSRSNGRRPSYEKQQGGSAIDKHQQNLQNLLEAKRDNMRKNNGPLHRSMDQGTLRSLR